MRDKADRVQNLWIWARDTGAGIWGAVKQAAEPPLGALKDALEFVRDKADRVHRPGW